MHHSNSLSYQIFPDKTTLDPPAPPQPPPPPPPYGPPPQPGTIPAASLNTIYVQRFASSGHKPTHETSWSSSMYGCCADMNSCIVTAACPCITAGRIAEIVDEGKTSCLEGVILFALFSALGVHCIYTCQVRSRMRKRHMLRGNHCDDCVAHIFCTACALCQEYRELYRLGLDPGIGWHENVERQKHAVAVFKITPPPVEKGMMR